MSFEYLKIGKETREILIFLRLLADQIYDQWAHYILLWRASASNSLVLSSVTMEEAGTIPTDLL